MRRIWPVLTFVWGALIVGGAVNIASNKYGTLFENARILFYTVLVLVFFGLASLLAYRDWRKKQAIGEFDLCKSASLLEPEDVGFKAARPGEAVLVGRPYFADIYVKRTAVPYSQRHSENHLEFTESDIKSALKRGESVLFIGSPTEGKTRTIFEIVKHMEDFLVLRPKRDHMPTDEAISITSDRKVVLILDDFDAFSTSTVNLAELYEKISKSASCCALISACRNGAEFECLVLAATPLQKIYESFVYRLVLQRPSDTEKGWLKLALNESSTRNFPTLGSICLREAFDVMRDRIQNISGAAQDCFHALHLLSGGGVDPLSHSRLKGVLEDVFERPTSGSALRDSLRELERYGLVLSSANADPVRVETAYVLGPETDSYYKGQQPVKGDFPKLACALLKRDDAIGLNQLAWNYYTRNDSSSAFATWTSVAEAFSSRCEVAFQIEVAKSILNAGWCLTQKQDDTKAMVYFDKVEKLFSASKEPEIREVVDITLTNKVALKSKIGDFSDVIRCCDEIEARIGFGKEFGARPMIAKALVNKAIALDELCRPNEALACYDDLDRRFGSDREPSVLEGLVQGLVNKGIMLVKMGLAREAINWYSNLETRLNSNTDPNVQVQVGRIMVNKGDALCGLYSFTDGMEIYESAYRYLATLDPSSEIRRVSARALMGKGVALGREGKTLEQRACYDEIESILNDDPGPESRSIVARALTNKAATFSGDTSLSIYSEIERRFGSDDDPTVLDEVIRAMKHEAAALTGCGNTSLPSHPK